ncbi:integrator complex subunit 12 [Diachasma alloeum]|uniref:integrator complex subunit 12 n=1 Tax=Diachasma alloeum TaxID=454923 RepID=UPI000738416C|nr:integrator complex subunit 12 [Diachasma alloeum]XP_015113540.1 integrator complex subunit 12 [Diachasma alloeum]
MTHSDLDSHFVQGLRLLHSSNKDSVDQLRSLLDEAIKQKHGLSKMLCNVLHKKYTMEEPVLSDHSSTSSKRSKSSSSSSKHSHKSSKSDSPEELIARTPPDLLISDDPLGEILEDDLTCVVCKVMDVGARNRLVECADCYALYHQECHTPHIPDTQIDAPKTLWYCSNCIKAHQPAKDKPPPKPLIESKKNVKKSTSRTVSGDDLPCVICKVTKAGARNRLVECGDCYALYHQECHTPQIPDAQVDAPKTLWYCSNCIKTHQPAKDEPPPKSLIDSKKDVKKSTSSSKHSEKYKSSFSHSVITDSAASKMTPSINIITGDRRIKDVTKKGKGDKRSSSTSSSKYTSSSSSSKNFDKSSRKND